MLWQSIPVALHLTLMLLLNEDGYSVPYRTNVKNVHSFTSTPVHFISTVCKHKNNLTFTFLPLNLKKKNSSGFFITFSRTDASVQRTRLPVLIFPSTY